MNHLHLYACPAAVTTGPPLQIAGRSIKTLISDERQIAQTCFSVSFEQVFERMQQLKRMFIELDGSFVWAGTVGNHRWQLDGMLYDHNGQLQRVELKGACPVAAWKELLTCLDWPRQSILAHCLEWHSLIDINEWMIVTSNFPNSLAKGS